MSDPAKIVAEQRDEVTRLLSRARIREGIVFCSVMGPGHVLVCGLSSGHLLAWDLTTVAWRRRHDKGAAKAGRLWVGSAVYSLCIIPDDRLVCACDQFTAVYPWKLISEAAQLGSFVKALPVAKFVAPQQMMTNGGTMAPAEANAVVWDGDAKTLWIGSGDGFAYAWDPETGRESNRVKAASDALLSLAWARSARKLVAGSEDGTVSIYDARQETLVQTLRPAEDQRAHCAALAIDDEATWLACAGGLEPTGPKARTGWLATYHASSGSLSRFTTTEATCHALETRGSQLFVGSDAGLCVWSLYDDAATEPVKVMDVRVDAVYSIQCFDPAPAALLDATDLPNAPPGPDTDNVALDVGPIAAVVSRSPLFD